MRKTLLLGILTCMMACTGKEDDTGSSDTDSDTDSEEVDGATVFEDNCVACHGADGTGGAGADLTAEVPGMTEEEVQDVVLNGSENMGAISVSEDEAAAVATYVVASFGG